MMGASMQLVMTCWSRVRRDSLTYVVAAVAFLWIGAAAFWAVPGPFTNDDIIYRAMIDAFARGGSLFVSNGYEEYGSPSLKLALLRTVDGQLASQYPGGWGILAAPAYLIGGMRGVLLVNALASALTLPMIWLAASALFRSRNLAARAALIYALATFAIDHAFAIWPHSASTLLVTTAFTAAAIGWRGTGEEELKAQLVSGLAIGIAINLRVDAVLAVAGLVVWQMSVSRRPFLGLCIFALGLAPGFISAAAINYAKFGTLSPISYGSSGGKASIGKHIPSLPTIIGGLLALLALARRRTRAIVRRRESRVALLAVAVMFTLVVPSLRSLAIRILEGFWVLVIDFQAHPLGDEKTEMMHGGGVALMNDGTIRIYGTIKKSLLQSVPYAAVLLVLLPQVTRGPNRGAIALCLLFMLPFLGFFAINIWHGGMGSNMRYFLTILPVLSILSALAQREIAALPRGGTHLAVAVVTLLCIGAISYAHSKGYSFEFLSQHTLPNAVAGGIAATSLLVLLVNEPVRAVCATTCRALVTLGLALAFASAWYFDLQASRERRGTNLEMARLTADLPKDALVASFSIEQVAFRLNRPPALTAQADFSTWEIDSALKTLVRRAFLEERPVFAQGRHLAQEMVHAGIATIRVQRYGISDQYDLYEMAPPGNQFMAP